jgi:regulatory protein
VSDLERAKALALRLLSARARSEKQLGERLIRSGLGAEVEEVLGWLRRLGYLDDGAYARARARSLLAPGRLGPRLAERRLEAAGVDPAAARDAVSAAAAERAGVLAEAGPGPGEQEDPEVTLCRAALERKLRGVDPASLDERGRARLARFLRGRGYSADAVARVIGLGEQ